LLWKYSILYIDNLDISNYQAKQTNLMPRGKGDFMKMVELVREATRLVAKKLRQGYLITPEDAAHGYIFRVDLGKSEICEIRVGLISCKESVFTNKVKLVIQRVNERGWVIEGAPVEVIETWHEVAHNDFVTDEVMTIQER
jgi:hypothetical protein